MNDSITIPLDTKIEIPMLPNYLRLAGQEKEMSIDIANLTDVSLHLIGERWTMALIEKACERRNNKIKG